MDAAERALLRDLLTHQTVLFLGVVANGRPIVALLPFAASADLGTPR